MEDASKSWEDGLLAPPDYGCCYVLDVGRPCGAPRRGQSSYCAEHHTVCHLTSEQAVEKAAEFEALGRVAGGRMALGPLSERILRRLERGAPRKARRI
jgi:hypothetical protein